MLALTGSTAASYGDDLQPTPQPARPPADGLAYPVPAPILADPEAPIDLAGTVPTSAVPADDGSGARYDILDATHGGNGTVPARVLRAYQQAALRLTADDPDCHLTWQLLAAIGRIESNHAANRTVASDGTVTPAVFGPALDGTNGTARIHDTDDGRLDQDTIFDRAVGPMQFIPTTWASSGRDGNSDDTKDPNNIDDATLAAAGYLCAHDRDLADPTDLRAAIYSYNPSHDYVTAVLAWKAVYDGTPTTATVSLATGGLPTGLPTTAPLATPPAPRATTSATATATASAPVATSTTAPNPTPRPTTTPVPVTVPRPTTTPTAKPTTMQPFPIFTLTPRATPTPSQTPPAPTSTPTPPPPATPTPTTTPCPDTIIDLSTLAATAVDLDPDLPGYEALDVTGVLAGTGTDAVDITVSVPTAGAAGPTTSVTLSATPNTKPQLLGRLPGTTVSEITTTGTLTLELVATTGDCRLGPYTMTIVDVAATALTATALTATTSPTG